MPRTHKFQDVHFQMTPPLHFPFLPFFLPCRESGDLFETLSFPHPKTHAGGRKLKHLGTLFS